MSAQEQLLWKKIFKIVKFVTTSNILTYKCRKKQWKHKSFL